MPRNGYKWFVVGMLWCICFFDYADRWGVSALFPLLKKELHLTPVQLGLLGSVSAWIYELGAPFAGYVAERIGASRAISLSSFVYVAAGILLTTASALFIRRDDARVAE